MGDTKCSKKVSFWESSHTLGVAKPVLKLLYKRIYIDLKQLFFKVKIKPEELWKLLNCILYSCPLYQFTTGTTDMYHWYRGIYIYIGATPQLSGGGGGGRGRGGVGLRQ